MCMNLHCYQYLDHASTSKPSNCVASCWLDFRHFEMIFQVFTNFWSVYLRGKGMGGGWVVKGMGDGKNIHKDPCICSSYTSPRSIKYRPILSILACGATMSGSRS